MLFLLLAITAGMIALSRAFGGEVTLRWNPNPAEELVSSYRIYRGTDLLSTVAGTTTSTKITLPDEPVTLGLVAVNSLGTSPAALLHLIPITIQTSPDLATWTAARTIHRERKPAEFYRLKIQP